jgi:hypothetical protein
MVLCITGRAASFHNLQDLSSQLPGYIHRERLLIQKMAEQRLPFTHEEFIAAGRGCGEYKVADHHVPP